MSNENREATYTSPYDLDGRLPFAEAFLLGLQHVVAMFAGNMTPILLITAACGIGSGSGLQMQILQSTMLMAGLMTMVQLFTIGPVGSKLPVVMGTSSGFIGAMSGMAANMGGGVAAYGAILGASLVGGLFEGALGFFLPYVRRFFPSVVTGVVVMAIGLSLITVGVHAYGGGREAGDFGSAVNLFVATVVLLVIIVLKHGTKGFTSHASILIGIAAGYLLCGILGTVLPTTYIDADGSRQVCAWALEWDKVAEAGWFALPSLMPVAISFKAEAILPIGMMFVVSAVETIGDISAVAIGGLGREATDRELAGSVLADGLGSSAAALFGVLPNTTFSQNVGLVAMTKIVNRYAISLGAVFLVLCGLLPKLAAVVSIMPQSVLGGAAVMMFASIVVSGIQLITRDTVTARTVTIVSVALGVGYGFGANAAILDCMPETVRLIFGGSGIVPAAVCAIVMNLLLPEAKKETEGSETPVS